MVIMIERNALPKPIISERALHSLSLHRDVAWSARLSDGRAAGDNILVWDRRILP